MMKVANFRIGTKDRNGRDHFINCSAWNAPGSENGRADVVMRNLCKGRHVLIKGIPNATHGKGRDGKDYANLGVIVNELEFLDRKPDSMRQNQTEDQTTAEAATETPAQPAASAIDPAVMAALQALLAQQKAAPAATQQSAVVPAQPEEDGPDFSCLEDDGLPF